MYPYVGRQCPALVYNWSKGQRKICGYQIVILWYITCKAEWRNINLLLKWKWKDVILDILIRKCPMVKHLCRKGDQYLRRPQLYKPSVHFKWIQSSSLWLKALHNDIMTRWHSLNHRNTTNTAFVRKLSVARYNESFTFDRAYVCRCANPVYFV